MASKPKQKKQPEKGEETRYYQRIIVMLMNLGTDTLLKLFKSLIPQGDVSLFLDSMFNEVEKLKTSKTISAAEYNRISKRPLVGTKLDIAILIKLMLELLPKKLQQVSSKLLPFTADLQRLRRIRNELIGHRPAATITKKEFDYYWEMISIILKRILPKDQSMEELDKRMENCKTGTVSDADVQKMLEKFAKLSSLITQAEALGEKKKGKI
ncbi:uncharacterized protein LOC128558970 [Mercenaria mercenaria]|uniref:uncharacterized protein LOC128558970 n=1 Tax=Mercenaria mercenaria TaxID=6596 RepID=UPI00234F682C|nr:uncharacterized protein LOC128558970 [Mercenaria mercenaria]